VSKLNDVKISGKPRHPSVPKGSLTIDADTAKLVRRVCRHEGMDVSSFVDAMLRTYIERHHPDWETVEQPPPAKSPRWASASPAPPTSGKPLFAVGGQPEPDSTPAGTSFGRVRRITLKEAEGYGDLPPRNRAPGSASQKPAKGRGSRKARASAGSGSAKKNKRRYPPRSAASGHAPRCCRE
jgi:hypothetical protein